MDTLKETLAENIIRLRKDNNLTQAELADKLNYSDKAISKWERKEAIPDIFILKKLSDIFNVSVDFLLSKHDKNEKIKNLNINSINMIDKKYLTLLAATPVWIITIFTFVFVSIFMHKYLWFLFYISVPLTAIVYLVFNSLYGNKRYNYLIISILIWTIIISTYFSLFNKNLWQIFILGIPAQIAIIFWSKLKKKKS